jgi:hypothetical protein
MIAFRKSALKSRHLRGSANDRVETLSTKKTEKVI